MADPALPATLMEAVMAYGPGGIIGACAIAWGLQQRADAKEARTDAAEARKAKDALGERYTAEIRGLTEQLALSREVDRQTQGALVEVKAAIERSGTHRIIP